MLGPELEELKEMTRRLHQAIHDVDTWPDDDEVRGLVAELRQLQQLLEEKLPPPT